MSKATGSAAIYCRVSDKGAKDAYGMDSQERECRAYAAERGWEVADVYHEWHTGAELFERPELSRLRVLAAREHRSLHGQILYLLERATEADEGKESA